MTRAYRFVQVDVFTDQPFGGNQLAVFPDAAGLSTAEMQALTREINYSESTFVLPGSQPSRPRVRIFTPGRELQFAGHPTIGTAFVLARDGLWAEPQEVVLEEGIGPVRVQFRRDPAGLTQIWMQHPLPQWGAIFSDRAAVAQLLGLDESDFIAELPIQVVSTGAPFLYVPVRSLDAMRRIRFDMSRVAAVFAEHEPVSVFAFTTETEQPTSTVHSRMFAPHTFEIAEDAATGAASGPLGAYLVRYNLVPVLPTTTIVSEQGIELGRPSYISITVSTTDEAISDIWIGGQVVLIAEGTFWLPDAPTE